MSKNADYWRGRFSIQADAAQREAGACVADLEAIYRDAERTVHADLERWYGRFATNNGITLTEARKMLTTGQMEEFRWTVDQYIQAAQQANLSPEWIKKLENASARFHVSRLETIQLQIQQQMELLYGGQLDSLDGLLKNVVSNGYTHTAFEIQKGLGLGWDITALNQRKLETLLSRPWTADGKTFRDRCWEHKANFVSGVQSTLTQGLLRGDSLQKLTDQIKDKFRVSQYKAGRLAHTETTYFNAIANLDVYRELGVEQIEILETLDKYTCELCGPLDGTVIPISQYEPGVTVPPFHPNCRGTTCPHYSDMSGERAARNAEGEMYYVPANMNYAAWEAAFMGGGDKSGLTLAVVNGIIQSKPQKNGGSDVQTVGRIDIEKYRCITDGITTDEVIITDERIQHIEAHHPGHYEKVSPFLQAAFDAPDYILKDKNPNTALILKEVEKDGLRIQVVLRLHTSTDVEGFKNSIISAWEISENRWNNYLRNKTILYKRE